MTTTDFITELFCRVDERLGNEKHVQAKLYASDVVTLALLYALKGLWPTSFLALAGAGLSALVSQFT